MDVAISGDRASCLTQQLASGTYLFAIANGFGIVDGHAAAPHALNRLRQQFERRAKPELFRRSASRAKAVSAALAGSFTRVNQEIHARTASHDDYVTSACSLTAALVIHDRVFLAHVGSTAAYLARDGYVVGLTKTDTFEQEGLPILTRALGVQDDIEVTSCSFGLSDGDALVLCGKQVRETDERRLLSERLSYGSAADEPGENLLVIRYAGDEEEGADATEAHTAPTVLTGILATVMFYMLLCIR
jgi:serine/threonine protein phosphatase PrpC